MLRQFGLPAFGSKCSFFCFVVLEECHGTLGLLVTGKLLRITKSAESRAVSVRKSRASRSEIPNLRGVLLSFENVWGRFQVLVGEGCFSNPVPMDSWKTAFTGRFSRCGQGPGSLHLHRLSGDRCCLEGHTKVGSEVLQSLT